MACVGIGSNVTVSGIGCQRRLDGRESGGSLVELGLERSLYLLSVCGHASSQLVQLGSDFFNSLIGSSLGSNVGVGNLHLDSGDILTLTGTCGCNDTADGNHRLGFQISCSPKGDSEQLSVLTLQVTALGRAELDIQLVAIQIKTGSMRRGEARHVECGIITLFIGYKLQTLGQGDVCLKGTHFDIGGKGKRHSHLLAGSEHEVLGRQGERWSNVISVVNISLTICFHMAGRCVRDKGILQLNLGIFCQSIGGLYRKRQYGTLVAFERLGRLANQRESDLSILQIGVLGLGGCGQSMTGGTTRHVAGEIVAIFVGNHLESLGQIDITSEIRTVGYIVSNENIYRLLLTRSNLEVGDRDCDILCERRQCRGQQEQEHVEPAACNLFVDCYMNLHK